MVVLEVLTVLEGELEYDEAALSGLTEVTVVSVLSWRCEVEAVLWGQTM